MKLIQLLRPELTLSMTFIVFIATLSGLSNASVLIIINAVSGEEDGDTFQLFYIIVFIIAILIYIYAQRYILIIMSKNVDEALHNIRIRIIHKIQTAEYLTLEKIGRSEIYSIISKDIRTISDATIVLVMMCQAVIFLFFAMIYIAIQSFIALGLYLAITSMMIFIYLKRNKRVNTTMHNAITRENEMLDAVAHLIDGFKEVKMNDLRRIELNEHIVEISKSAVDMHGEAKALLSEMNIFGQTTYYFLTAAMVFFLPSLVSLEPGALSTLTATTLFLMAPLTVLVGGAERYVATNVAAQNIEDIEEAINQHVRPMARRRAEPLIIHEPPFHDITFEHVQFEYVDAAGDTPFQLGPIDLFIATGETIFIAGGNGSGKSTFLNLLTCLYFPTSGDLKLDGQRVSETNAITYRNLFSVIFYDYHLFDRLYGIHDIDEYQVETLLQQLQLSDKTRLVDRKFETLNLSTGQKRRLAMLVLYLENKPICVFDEWAAEQDPEYRRYFYTAILPELKARGKTIIAVTHDDRYYDMDYVDRILRFEEGRLVSDTSTSADTATPTPPS